MLDSWHVTFCSVVSNFAHSWGGQFAWKKCNFKMHIKIWIGDYAKDGGSEEVWLLCSFNHEHLHTWIKTNVNEFAILSQTVAKLGVQNLESYMRLKFEYELDILSNTKVSLAKIHGENYSLSSGFWQSFISIEVCRDCIPALASSCKKQLTGYFVCLLFFLKVKRIS